MGRILCYLIENRMPEVRNHSLLSLSPCCNQELAVCWSCVTLRREQHHCRHGHMASRSQKTVLRLYSLRYLYTSSHTITFRNLIMCPHGNITHMCISEYKLPHVCTWDIHSGLPVHIEFSDAGTCMCTHKHHSADSTCSLYRDLFLVWSCNVLDMSLRTQWAEAWPVT